MIIILGILGLFIGSFLTVLIDRIPRGEGVIGGRSHCENCSKTLLWMDMIPVFSYLWLRGRCRYCKKKIGWHHAALELLTAALYVSTYFYLVSAGTLAPITLLYTLFMVSVYIVIFFIDIFYGIIPDKIIIPAVFVSVVYLLVFSPTHLLPFFLSAAGASLFFLFLFLVTRGKGMGFGDVKFAFLLGLFLGFPRIVVALYVAFLTGATVALILIIWRKKKFFGGMVAFGPFLVLGALLSLVLSDLFIKTFLIRVLP